MDLGADRSRRGARLVTAGGCLLAGAALALGCGGDPDLWARYRVERGLWRAERLAAKLTSGLSPEASAAGALEALDAVVAQYAPLEARDLAEARPMAREVALLAGRAALLAGWICEFQGRHAVAADRYATAVERFAGIDSIADEASAGQARCLEGLGRDAEAVEAWGALAARRRFVDASGVRARPRLAEAANEAAELLEALEWPGAADSLRRSVAAALVLEAGRRIGPLAAQLWDAAAAVEIAAGEFAAGRAALRSALREEAASGSREARVLGLVECSSRARQPDSAAAYANWVAREFPGPSEQEASLLVAGAWADAAVADSSLAVYKRLVDLVPPASDVSARARLRRALLLERLDRWESARAELRTLATIQPAHPCGLQAIVRIVQHHAEAGENELMAVEARHALSLFDQLLSAQRDPTIRARLQSARAEVRVLTGEVESGARDFAEVWHRYPGNPVAAAAGFRSARLEDSALGRADRARPLYQDLAERSRDPAVRRAARRAAARGGSAGR